jgi:hypothetical protein
MISKAELTKLKKESDAIESAARQGVRAALRAHKSSGDPVVFCEHGVVRWVSADQITICEESPKSECDSSNGNGNST